ncbi:hypothetical protein AC578_3077 [Pseudocercospora eumusae]|uniref:Uncharacterized protein n=1 Tax=Pseudocercospora eumusae TaxID=321146 RepID=A0A139H1U7_9PEZI|nr:hypothetical protein AC578_3077 [Pseudocercospora eumusae]
MLPVSRPFTSAEHEWIDAVASQLDRQLYRRERPKGIRCSLLAHVFTSRDILIAQTVIACKSYTNRDQQHNHLLMPSFRVSMETNNNGGKKMPDVLTGVGSYFDKSEQKNSDDRKKSKILEQGIKSDKKKSNISASKR